MSDAVEQEQEQEQMEKLTKVAVCCFVGKRCDGGWGEWSVMRDGTESRIEYRTESCPGCKLLTWRICERAGVGGCLPGGRVNPVSRFRRGIVSDFW